MKKRKPSVPGSFVPDFFTFSLTHPSHFKISTNFLILILTPFSQERAGIKLSLLSHHTLSYSATTMWAVLSPWYSISWHFEADLLYLSNPISAPPFSSPSRTNTPNPGLLLHAPTILYLLTFKLLNNQMMISYLIDDYISNQMKTVVRIKEVMKLWLTAWH